MARQKIVYWEDDGMWLGYFEEYPDYWTQGKSLQDLKANLLELHNDLPSGGIPHMRKVAALDLRQTFGSYEQADKPQCEAMIEGQRLHMNSLG